MRPSTVLSCAAVLILLTSLRAATADFADGFESPIIPDPDPGGDGPCAEEVFDDITFATTWTNGPADCDYLIGVRNAGDPTAPGSASVRVSNGLLTIEPGTVIRFAQDASVSFADNGGLRAVGTPTQRIVFASRQPIPGFGRGLFFGFDAVTSRIEFADLVNLGKETTLTAQDAAIAAAPNSGAGLILKNTTVSGSVTIGAELDEFALLEFAENQFFNNAQYGLRVNGPQLPLLDTASDYVGAILPNGRPFILVEGVSPRDRVAFNGTWKNLNAPYYIDIALTIQSGHVTLQAGVSIVAGAGSAFKIDGPGSLSAIGTPQQPITFTGEQARSGYWDGINFFESDSPDNRFDYVEVRHGGGDRGDANIDLDKDAFLSLSHSRVTDSANIGVCVSFRSELVQGDGNVFENNPAGDVVTDGC